jgi:molybdate transport system substrate-binding protein
MRAIGDEVNMQRRAETLPSDALPGVIYAGILPGMFTSGRIPLASYVTVVIGAALLVAGHLATAARASPSITVFAAASLREALDAQARRFEAETGNRVVVSYAGSNALARQIEAGAPADAFISADLDWMDYLEQRRLIAGGSRLNLLRGVLVLVAPARSAASLKIEPRFQLAAALDSGKLAMANPDSVPAGKYGKAALQALGVWSSVETGVVRTDNVRAALLLVARGEAAFGIVYRTDALAEKNVRIVDTFPESSHAPIVYPAARIAGRDSSAATAFLAFLHSGAARATWERYGFTPY